MAVMPSTRPILAMLDPMAFPIASFGAASSDAEIATSISGADVPIDTIVSPIKRLETPRLAAVVAAPDTKRSALHTRSINPATRLVMDSNKVKMKYVEVLL